jgi:hypothetical protein
MAGRSALNTAHHKSAELTHDAAADHAERRTDRASLDRGRGNTRGDLGCCSHRLGWLASLAAPLMRDLIALAILLAFFLGLLLLAWAARLAC